MTEDRNHWTYYGTAGYQLVPMMEGTPVFKDGVLSALYYRTKEEGNIGNVFHEDSFGHDNFVAYFQKIRTLQVLCEVNAEENLKPVGYSWVDAPVGVDGARAVLCGFCFFDNAGKREAARALAMLGLAYWFIAMRIDVVHGAISEYNTTARNFSKRLGFREVALVPKWRYVDGRLTNVYVTTLEKEEFMPGFEEWRQENPATISKKET
jgi:RimJ/RimL family protein N-acetyltransferase